MLGGRPLETDVESVVADDDGDWPPVGKCAELRLLKS